MRNILTLSGFAFSLSLLGAPIVSLNATKQKPVISFTENKGQVHDQDNNARPDVLYGAMAGEMAVHIRNNGVSYQLCRAEAGKEKPTAANERNVHFRVHHREQAPEIKRQTIYRIDLYWVNANPNFIKAEDEVLPGYTNYYSENSPYGALNIKSYKGITLRGLYDNIDLHYYEKNGDLKHDYIVAPHADYKKIQIRIEGADVSANEDGSLVLTSPHGKIIEGAPLVYQNSKQLNARWVVKNNVLGFEIQNYNPDYLLIIDPITRLWGTYYGGTLGDNGRSCATDGLGNVYLAGMTETGTGTIIATNGSHQSVYGTNYDAYLAKFNASGVRLWATYYGGGGSDFGSSCVTDASGNIYLCGSTGTMGGTVIATPGSHQAVSSGSDAFLVKFDANGVRIWGTYYGNAAGGSNASSIATDATGNVYMAGITTCTGTALSTPGAHQATFGGGNQGDLYLVKFNSGGVRQWSTYYGSNADDMYASCTTDGAGNVYLGGGTTSNNNLYSTPGSHQPAYGGGYGDAFLVKFNSSGVRQWATFYGGNFVEANTWCAADATGNVYLSGYSTTTQTGTTVATPNGHQPANGTIGSSSTYDAFLVKFNTNGVRQWGTYYGGPEGQDGLACAVDPNGNVYLTGYTEMPAGPSVVATPGSHQTTYGGNLYDAYLVKFNTNGVRQWGTYYGGPGFDYGWAIAADANGNVFLSGSSETKGGTSIASANGHQPVANGTGTSNEGFLAMFKECNTTNPSITGNPSPCQGATINFSVSVTATSSPTYSWQGPNGFMSSLQNPSIPNANVSHVGVYTVTINNGGCIEYTTAQVTNVNPLPVITVNSGTICSGSSFTIQPTGASTYTFGSGGPVVSPTVTTTYTVAGTSGFGCVSSNTPAANVHVNSVPVIGVSSTHTVLCSGETATLMAQGAFAYTFNGTSAGSNFTISPTTTTNYTVIGTDANGCKNSSVFLQTVSECTGTDQLSDQKKRLTVFPNPAKEFVYLIFGYDGYFNIVNVLGEIVYSAELSSGQHQINLDHLAKGIYFISAVHDEGSETIRLIKE